MPVMRSEGEAAAVEADEDRPSALAAEGEGVRAHLSAVAGVAAPPSLMTGGVCWPLAALPS